MRGVWGWMGGVVLMVSASAMPAGAQGARVAELELAGPVAEIPLKFSGKRDGHVIQLRNVDAGADPRLQLLGATGASAPATRLPAKVPTLRLPAGTSGAMTLLLRSGNKGSYRADVWVDGEPVARRVTFSNGATFTLPRLAEGEEIVAVSPPNGAKSHVAYLLSADGSRILARTSGASTTLGGHPEGGQVMYALPRGIDPGNIIVIINDRFFDSDRDGLGNALEAALGTCASRASRVPGVDCAAIADPRDTDGDALWDSWEVMGKFQSVNGVSVQVPLHTWGANPRHKDIFIEIDFRRLTLQDNQTNLEARMPPSIARQLAGVYGDMATTDPALRALHAQDVSNPDGLPGISLHMDTGVPPETPADAAIYGNWGGYTAVNAVPNGSGGYRPLTPGESMATNFSDARRGLFHYVLAYTSGGGSCGVGIACGFNMNSVGVSAHEFGHTLWLDHNGPAGTHEPNCKPNYPSLMNYAYFGSGYNRFSDGRGFPALNNHWLIETSDETPDPTWVNVLQNVFSYRVDPITGSVDWNRDGSYQSAAFPVRAYANYRPYDGGGCEFTREGEVNVGTKSPSTPAVVRYNGLLWVFTVTMDHQIEYSYTSTPWTCAQVDNCPTPNFPYHVIRGLGPVQALDAAAINVNGNKVMIIVGIRPDGSMFETWMHMNGWQVIWEGTIDIPGTTAAGEPSLAVSADGTRVAMMYKGIDNIVRFRTRGTGLWNAEQMMLVGSNPVQIHPDASPGLAYTGLPVGIVANQESLTAAIADPNGSLRLYTQGGFPLRGWQGLGIPYEYMSSPIGRPAMAWTGQPPVFTDGSGPSLPITWGRFHLAYLEKQTPTTDQPWPYAVRMATSYVDSNGSFRIGLQGYFDNVWAFAFGIDLLQPGEVGLRAAMTSSINKPEALNKVTFRPHADGISNLTYSNKNDWPVLGWGTCSVLAHVQPAGMKTSCPVKPF